MCGAEAVIEVALKHKDERAIMCVSYSAPAPQTRCKPVCKAIGTSSEGWYDSCTGKLIKYANCRGCEAVCKNVGTRSEGWYSSCNGELIVYARCG